MTRTDFDRFAHDYEALLKSQTRLFDSDHEYFARYKVELMKGRTSIDARTILDFGCGTGRSTGFLHAAFPSARIVGCDPSHESLQLARRANPDCVFSDPGEIALRQQFDLIIASCVFHHIPPRERGDALRYCMERLNDNGQIFIFEHINQLTKWPLPLMGLELAGSSKWPKTSMLSEWQAKTAPNGRISRVHRAGGSWYSPHRCAARWKKRGFLDHSCSISDEILSTSG